MTDGRDLDYTADIYVTLPVSAPDGVLIRTVASADGRGSSNAGPGDCPKAGGISWWFDPKSYAAGEIFGYGLAFDLNVSRGQPNFTPGTTFSLSLPPRPPFSFAGRMPDGERCAGGGDDAIQEIAFVAPSANIYHFRLGLSSGSFLFRLDDGASFERVTSSAGGDQQLSAGVHVVYLMENNSGQTDWTISADDEPPRILRPRTSQVSGTPGQSATVRFSTSESGTLSVTVLRGGTPVRTLITKRTVGVGPQAVVWDGRLISGDAAPEGTYLIRLTETDWRNRQVTGDIPYFLAQTPQDATRGRAAVGKTARREGPSVLCKALKFS